MRNKPRALIVLVVLFAVITCAVLSGGCSNQKPEELTSDGLETTAGTEKTQDTTSGGESSVKTDGTTETKSGPGSDKSTTTKAATESTTAKQTVSGTEMKPFSSTQWKQKEFYLSGFTTGVNRESLTLAKEVGLNLVEFAFSGTELVKEAIKICDKIGLNCLPFDRGRWTAALGIVSLYNEEIVYSWIIETHQHKSVIGYYLWDEVMKNDITIARGLQNLFKKYDPARLAYIIVFPSYVHESWNNIASGNYHDAPYYKYVEYFLNTVKPDVLAFDYYPFGKHGQNLMEVDWWRDMGLMRMKSIEYNLPFWYYYQASELGEKKERCTVSEIRLQMYAGLAYGAKYLSAFNSSGRMYGGNGQKVADFEELKQNNHEVMTAGRFLFDKIPYKIYHTGLSKDYLTNGYFLDKIEESEIIKSTPDGLIISIFKDGKTSSLYILVVNKNHATQRSVRLELKSAKKISLLNKTSGSINVLGTSDYIDLALQPGGGELYVIG